MVGHSLLGQGTSLVYIEKERNCSDVSAFMVLPSISDAPLKKSEIVDFYRYIDGVSETLPTTII